MFTQLFTALGCVGGAFFAFAAEQLPYSSEWILPFTAGGFIYIALAGVLPHLFEKTSFCRTIFEIIAMFVGVSLMVLITIIE